MQQEQASDLIAETFLVLRNAFFDANGDPINYSIKDKRNTQDDPLDRHIHTVLTGKLPKGIVCEEPSGPNTAPDLAVLRPGLCDGIARAVLASDLTRIAAVEVKKLERVAKGGIARAKGMDYNTTPPCGKVRVYDQRNEPLDIRGFYLYVSQQPVQGEPGTYSLSALALCDGNLLNEDFALYLSVTGPRTKKIGLGTYANGADRTRPMLIFANPLGLPVLDHSVTLVHPSADLTNRFQQLGSIGMIRRTDPQGNERTFTCYRLKQDIPADHARFDLLNPFAAPVRKEATQGRGRFRVKVSPAD